MILMEEVFKLGGEAKDKIKTAAIATARKKDTIVTHAFATTCYAAATVGETTKEVAMVEHHEAMVGEVQYKFSGRGKGVIMEEDASTAILRGGHAPSQPCTPLWGKDEFLKKWGRSDKSESSVKITNTVQRKSATDRGVYTLHALE